MSYDVTVLFEQGYGERFVSLDAALEYAQQQMDRLLAEYEALESEAFDGIFCQCNATGDVWRFEWLKGEPMWAADDDARTLLSNIGVPAANNSAL